MAKLARGCFFCYLFMNKILQLFREDYVINLFREQVLPLYPEYKEISQVEIKPYKKMIWTNTYHVVIGYKVGFKNQADEINYVFIVCSAHSNEERKNVFAVLKYLWQKKFNQDIFDVPRPLFYSSEFNGTFYEGISGENLMYYIKKKDFPEIENMVILAAKLFSRLHKLPVSKEANFNPSNSRIKTVIPGSDIIIAEMTYRFEGKFHEDFKQIYTKLIEKEEALFARPDFKPCLIHGDAHTENIINTGAGRLGLIDFTDFCLSDFTRDVGTFMQQLEYKIMARHDNDTVYAKKMSALFLQKYLLERNLTLTPDLDERIKLYYDWTAVRTVVYLFLKHDSDPAKAEILLNKVKQDLAIK
ncbi:MAG: Phosphotransferase enzyme family [Patescibacteria group bacterium]|nr:Phosphotransferase enzyme family [Patescibacteria group bacterium]